MIKKVLTAAVTAALFGIASVSWAQGAAGGGAAGGGTSGGAGGGGASPGSSSNVPGGSTGTVGGSTTSDAASGGSLPTQCAGLLGAERDRCVNDNRGRAGAGSSQTPTHPGDAAKGDNRYNSPATGTGAHSVPRSDTGTGTRQ
jgi:hypothetical protein